MKMDGNDGTSTELFPGWSSVVHQPAEEPEESDLPSTVDIAAFSTGLNVEPNNSQNNDNSDSESDSEVDSSNSGTEASQSCSQSDSSDSDSSTSSQGSSSRSPSPQEFSVTSSQTNGLRLTIATVRKVNSPTMAKSHSGETNCKMNSKCGSSGNSDSSGSSDTDSDNDKSEHHAKVQTKSDASAHKSEASGCRSGLRSAREALAARKAVVGSRTRSKVLAEKKDDKNCRSGNGSGRKDGNGLTSRKVTSASRAKQRQRRTRKMASLPLSRGSTYSTSDSDDSDADSAMLASCSLQEIRQEDLAAILPDQQELDAFNDFECDRDDKNSPAAGDMSSSDMELSHQAVNALIQRTTESSSEGETHANPNPGALYANSLLEQFVAQTQMLNAPCAPLSTAGDALKLPVLNASAEKEKTKAADGSKRRRGRPKKSDKESKGSEKKSVEYCANPNVSPDSGIQNSPDHGSLSPEPLLSHLKRKEVKKIDKSFKVSSTDVKSDKSLLKNVKVSNVKSVKVAPKSAATFKTKESNKIAVTSNRFDRVLYANADRVLYPPRRKAGRPPILKKGPGRPPKQKINSELDEVGCVEKAKVSLSDSKQHSKSAKGKSGAAKPGLVSKSKPDKGKLQTVKIPKLMHSKRKHKKHKKYKFNIMKPMGTIDPKITIEIDKLISDFVRYCAIAAAKPKETNGEQLLKALKKVTKKRKTTEHADKKKKKQSVSTTVNNKVNNSNEQRLPLKKRHYHLVSSNDCKTEENEEKDVSSEVKVEKNKVKQSLSTTSKLKSESVVKTGGSIVKSSASSPKTQTMNNNDYETKELTLKSVKTVTSHIDEAIEACINRFSDKKSPIPPSNLANEKKVSDEKASASVGITATTPKKRHRLEMAVSPDRFPSSVVVKSEEPKVNVDVAKPKISIETFITELKVKRNLMQKEKMSANLLELQISESSKVEKKEDALKNVEIIDGKQPSVEAKETVKVSPELIRKKVRKRRAINRTGFPTVKKKKKKPKQTDPALPEPVSNPSMCDRVPKEGEEYLEFVQRTEKTEIPSPQSPEKTKPDDCPSKWELMSECESLPQDERTEFEDDMKPERMTLRNRDSSPATSVDTRISERSKNKLDLELDVDLEVSLESSIERLRSRLEDRKKRKRSKEKSLENVNGYPKRRVRDVSPASSIEPLAERRLRDERASASGDETKKNKKAPRWRKKYLVAGLFSDYYKEDDEAVRIKRTEQAQKNSRLVYNPSEHAYGLLPPPHHCGKYLRCRRLPFQLPFDLWWQHTHSQLPGRDIVPSWNYRKIRTNIYNVKTTTGACEPQPCNCKPSTNCGDDCINRLVLSECPASHRCQNQKIQRHEWAPGLEKFMTESKGWGVRTKLPIKQGEFILEYVGEVVSDQEFKERMATIYVHDTHHYCLHLDGGLVIDGHRMGGDGRFVNHSCSPNCEMQKWSVNGQFRMALFALRDVQACEELTYDYNFSLFNPAEGQECKCGSELCRGVIGGKSQRIRQLPDANSNKNPGRVGRPRKTEAKKKSNAGKDAEKPQSAVPVQAQIQVKPMSHQQKCFILEHHCFLLRNLARVRKVRDRSLSTTVSVSRQQTATPTDTSAFLNHLNALQKPRNMKTRRIAQAEDDPELNKTVKLAAVLKDILRTVTTAKNEKGEQLSTPFLTMPSKRKTPEFYTKVVDPIDLSAIEQNIATGVYKSPNSFDEDFEKLFRSYTKFYGRTSETGIAVTKLRKIYSETKQQNLVKFQNALGEKPPSNSSSNRKQNEEEDIIRCICGIPRDEGLMIQCEHCLVWQHTECVKADTSALSYHCEICVPRKVDYEIPLDEYTEHGHRYYMTLMRGDLQLRQGDTVYVLRDIPIEGTDRKHTYDTIGDIQFSELDIFRIERLWKESDTGRRLAYGHHYLRPHETYHEPTRKFFPNEVMRVPLYEAVPVELIITHCWVMDLNTFCKGRPMGAPEEHVYICEYRVDKGAKMFSKISKNKFPICTKSFAFERFETRLKVSRTYTPHEVDLSLMKSSGRRHKNEEAQPDRLSNGAGGREIVHGVAVLPPVIRTPTEQKARLNKILLNLLSRMPTKQALDISYLLEGGRRRKKQNENNVNK